jgi:hypothetical protein
MSFQKDYSTPPDKYIDAGALIEETDVPTGAGQDARPGLHAGSCRPYEAQFIGKRYFVPFEINMNKYINSDTPNKRSNGKIYILENSDKLGKSIGHCSTSINEINIGNINDRLKIVKICNPIFFFHI